MPIFTKAEEGPKSTVVYTSEDGNKFSFSGGDRNWRNQNPGNLVPGIVSKRNGAIGKAGPFAVFPDYETGHRALLDSLKNMHGNKDIPTLMEAYAPKKENNTKRYIAFIRKKTGVKGTKKVKDFSASEFEKLWQGIEQMEGWGKGKEGTVTPYSEKKEITAVEKNKKGTIQSYQIESYGWIPKSEAIALTLDGKVNAVVATSPRGNQFLRARPNSTPLDNLESKG